MGQLTTMFTPHPNLGDEVNSRIVQSEIEGGVFLEDLEPETALEIETQHHCYTAILLSSGEAFLCGHPRYCPEPVLVAISGSTWGGSMLKLRFIGRGMHLEFCHPDYRTPIVTSPVREIRELGKGITARFSPSSSFPASLTNAQDSPTIPRP